MNPTTPATTNRKTAKPEPVRLFNADVELRKIALGLPVSDALRSHGSTLKAMRLPTGNIYFYTRLLGKNRREIIDALKSPLPVNKLYDAIFGEPPKAAVAPKPPVAVDPWVEYRRLQQVDPAQATRFYREHLDH